jgi:threonine dehydratase
MLENYVKKILTARVYDIAVETPLQPACRLSQRYHNNILIKREDLQPVFSFKIRGAYNKIAHLDQAAQQAGIIAASAGNHAQGVALAAQQLGLKALIVMPITTPHIKVASVRNYGAQVILHGDTFDQACNHSQQLVKERGYQYIHPYDDPEVIAGQGTIAMEIMRQCSSDIHTLFVPVGGGGLIAGIAAYVKYVRPSTQIIGVEPQDAACLQQALLANKRVVLPEVGLFADGVSVAQTGKEPFRVARHCVDQVITVSVDEICAAIKDIFTDTRVISEPAGALAIAGLKKYVGQHQLKDNTLVAINSGANINFDRLGYISERTQVGEKRESIFAIKIPEQPGSFNAFCQIVGKHNVTEFNYRYDRPDYAMVFVGIHIQPQSQDYHNLIAQLKKVNYSVADLSDNEMAKLHIRHMIGGHGPKITHELLYRFDFPERPGALLQFLQVLGNRWSISMFHYRNHGSAFGRILLGLQADSTEKQEVQHYLDKIGYNYAEETDNLAYKLFLA